MFRIQDIIVSTVKMCKSVFYLCVVILFSKTIMMLEVDVCPDFPKTEFFAGGRDDQSNYNQYSLAAYVRSKLHPPSGERWTCGTTTWYSKSLIYDLYVESNLPNKEFLEFRMGENSSQRIYMKIPTDERREYFWSLYIFCEPKNLVAFLGTTKPLIDETESKSILEPWLTSLNITDFGIDDFEYSSGVCKPSRIADVIWMGSCILVIALIAAYGLEILFSSID